MILAKNVCKKFGDRTVLKNVTLEIQVGETMVIMGASGTGKSVFLKIIMALLEPDAGEIWIDDKEITRLTNKEMDELRKRIGMVFQFSALFDSLTVGENVAFSLSRHTNLTRDQIDKIVAEKLEMVGLPGIEDVMPAELSGGMRKRVSLARAISMDPKIVLYDEPTTGLDPITADGINKLINKLHDQLKVTSIVVTHDMKSAFSVATRMAMLKDGEIIFNGTPDEIRQTDDPWVKEFINTAILIKD